MELYVFTFRDDLLLLKSASAEQACRRAYYEIATAYDLDASRLEEMGWPADSDYSLVGDLDEPVILDGEA